MRQKTVCSAPYVRNNGFMKRRFKALYTTINISFLFCFIECRKISIKCIEVNE